MDILQLEIEIARDELTRVAIWWDSEKLELGGFHFAGSEVNEVLLAIRCIKEQKLGRLMDLQNEGATS
jgi:hypothetical protein